MESSFFKRSSHWRCRTVNRETQKGTHRIHGKTKPSLWALTLPVCISGAPSTVICNCSTPFCSIAVYLHTTYGYPPMSTLLPPHNFDYPTQCKYHAYSCYTVLFRKQSHGKHLFITDASIWGNCLFICMYVHHVCAGAQ